MKTRRFVPESFAKKQNRDKKAAEDLVAARKLKHEQIVEKRKLWAQKGKTYFEKHREMQRLVINKKRDVININKSVG